MSCDWLFVRICQTGLANKYYVYMGNGLYVYKSMYAERAVVHIRNKNKEVKQGTFLTVLTTRMPVGSEGSR